MISPDSAILRWAARQRPLARHAWLLLPALAAGWLLGRQDEIAGITAVLGGWLVYCLGYLWLAAALVLRLDADETRGHAQDTDPGMPMLRLLVIVAACASLVAVVLAVDAGRTLAGFSRWLHVALVALSLAASWSMVQVGFALHYARLYYRPDGNEQADAGDISGGLDFPGGQAPDYRDFLYYATVIGMTSQVSDVTISGRTMRRLTMTHGVLSFAFNLVILALAINVIASLLPGK